MVQELAPAADRRIAEVFQFCDWGFAADGLGRAQIRKLTAAVCKRAPELREKTWEKLAELPRNALVVVRLIKHRDWSYQVMIHSLVDHRDTITYVG